MPTSTIIPNNRRFIVTGQIDCTFKPESTELIEKIPNLEIELWQKSPLEIIFLGKGRTNEEGVFEISFTVSNRNTFIENGVIEYVFAKVYANGQIISGENPYEQNPVGDSRPIINLTLREGLNNIGSFEIDITAYEYPSDTDSTVIDIQPNFLDRNILFKISETGTQAPLPVGYRSTFRCFLNGSRTEHTFYSISKTNEIEGYVSIQLPDLPFVTKKGTEEKNYTQVANVEIRTGSFSGDISDSVLYQLKDHLGSVGLRINHSGSTIDREEYYPFGDSSLRTFTKKRYRYCGKEKDEESGLYYYGARYYMAWACKFITCDPMSGKLTQWSSYVGFNDNPIFFTDPTGMEGEGQEDWIKAPGSNQWVWSDTVKVQGVENHETRPDGTEVAREGHRYRSSNGMVTLGGSKDSWTITPFPPSKTDEAEVAGTGMTRSQIDAAFNPEKEYVIGTIQEGLAQQISDQTQAELDRWKYDMYMEGFNRGIDNLLKFSGVVAVSPFIIGGAVVYGGGALSYTYSGLKFAATSYHYTFGVNGGYVSMASNVINQTSTQLSEKGNVRLGDFDLIALGSSGFITNQTSLVGQMVQGASGTYLSYSVNGGFDGALVNKKLSKSYIFTSTLNGMLNPLMNKAPIVQPIGNEVINGWIQGVLNKAEKSKKLK